MSARNSKSTQRQFILKRKIALGIKQLESGQYETFTDRNIHQLAEDICRAGRKRLAKLRG